MRLSPSRSASVRPLVTRPPHLVVAPDKFRGTASAAEVSAAAVRAAEDAGWSTEACATADGGEGTLEALGGEPRFDLVQGPAGDPVSAEWRMLTPERVVSPPDPATVPGPAAVIEMARCSGLGLAGGAGQNDPLGASTAGVGQLIRAAAAAGATQVVVACGGSASTDGGWGALDALGFPRRLDRVDLVAAYDVEVGFLEAVAFAPQKGADPAQVDLLRRRLLDLAELYQKRSGLDVRALKGAGAAGGLAGGLAAIGARLVSGFALVAATTGLAQAMRRADLVMTGEGYLDEHSFGGKVVGGVAGLARAAGTPVLVVVGDADPSLAASAAEVGSGASVVSLTEMVGRESALSSPLEAIESAVTRHLTSLSARP